MNLVKSTGTFGFYTIISRLLGYLRDILIAIFLGTSFLADVFFVEPQDMILIWLNVSIVVYVRSRVLLMQ